MESPSTGSHQSLRIPARRRRFLTLLTCSVLASWAAMAAVVSMHPPSGGGELRIPVMLYGDQDEDVSGLQFDLAYDPTQYELVGISAGDAATSADKEVILSESAPGQGRVLITGFNNNGMSDGQVATLTLRPLSGSAPQHDISLRQVLASDPDGNSVPIDYADLFQYPPAPPKEEEAGSVSESVDIETVNDSIEGPDTEIGQDSGALDGGETAAGSENVASRTPSGGLGNRFAGSESDGLDLTDDTEGSTARPAPPRLARSAPDALPSERTSESFSRPGRSDDTGYSVNGVARPTSGGTQNATETPTGKNSERIQGPGATQQEITSKATLEGATCSTELALLRPARLLVDSPPSGSPSYTLAMGAGSMDVAGNSTRTRLIAIIISLALTSLALACLLFGRFSRPQWRRTR